MLQRLVVAKSVVTTKVVNKLVVKKRALSVIRKEIRHVCTCHIVNQKTKKMHVNNLKNKMPKKKRCYNCGSTSHLMYGYKEKSLYAPMAEKVWVPKGTTNPSGPILKWVPIQA